MRTAMALVGVGLTAADAARLYGLVGGLACLLWGLVALLGTALVGRDFA